MAACYRFIAKYQLQIGAENESIYVLISSQQLYFMQKQNEVILQVSYKELFQCQWLRHGQFLFVMWNL